MFYELEKGLFLGMELTQARTKYLHKVVKHFEKPWLFEIEKVGLVVEQGEIKVKAEFRHLYYDFIPHGQPLDCPVEVLEDEFIVLG